MYTRWTEVERNNWSILNMSSILFMYYGISSTNSFPFSITPRGTIREELSDGLSRYWQSLFVRTFEDLSFALSRNTREFFIPDFLTAVVSSLWDVDKNVHRRIAEQYYCSWGEHWSGQLELNVHLPSAKWLEMINAIYSFHKQSTKHDLLVINHS